jgi:adenosylcobinamide-GDP ribazoletransferase
VKGPFEHVAVAFSYFSILPVRGSERLPAPDAAALVALPMVGAAIGACAGGAAWLVSSLGSGPLAVATAFSVPIVLSGAIHLDGFLDCSDAAFASVSPERRLEILKDPRHGTYAVAALAVQSVCTIAALSTCAPARLPRVLAFTGALSRLAAVWNARRIPYAPGGRRTNAFTTRPHGGVLALETLALLVASFGFGRKTCALVPGAYLAARMCGDALAARLDGGLVGDAYGFIIVALEPALIAFVVSSSKAT